MRLQRSKKSLVKIEADEIFQKRQESLVEV